MGIVSRLLGKEGVLRGFPKGWEEVPAHGRLEPDQEERTERQLAELPEKQRTLWRERLIGIEHEGRRYHRSATPKEIEEMIQYLPEDERDDWRRRLAETARRTG
jgi:hypothetical protein